MSLYRYNSWYQLREGNMLDEMKHIKDCSIDSIVTDPPYGLTSTTKRFGKENSKEVSTPHDGSFARLDRGFMGQTWDGSGIEYNVNTWKECLRVLKPGGHLLAFGGSRTFYRIACAIEDAGFEIRDTIMWIYGSGFPKSFNVGLAIDRKNDVDNRTGNLVQGTGAKSVVFKDNHTLGIGMYEERVAQNEWSGWGTSLKPAFEPIIMARKPLDGTTVENIEKYQVGALNIDDCKIGDEEINGGSTCSFDDVMKKQAEITGAHALSFGQVRNAERIPYESHFGRYPANVIHDCLNEEWAKYFYSPKATTKDRDEGLDSLDRSEVGRGKPKDNDDVQWKYSSVQAFKRNIHPTVKPTELMQYLIRLVTPPAGIILDPFMGSGSTGKAAMCENKDRGSKYQFIGIDVTPEYLPIADARIKWALECYEPNGMPSAPGTKQLRMF